MLKWIPCQTEAEKEDNYVEYLFLLQLKAVFLNLVYFADEHFQANRLLIKYW